MFENLVVRICNRGTQVYTTPTLCVVRQDDEPVLVNARRRTIECVQLFAET